MLEIEAKARLKDRAVVMAKLESLGCVFGKAMKQNDTVYVERHESLKDYYSNKAVLRLRVKDDLKILFTLKMRQKNDLVADEHEVEVSSKEEMEKMILLMGYKEAVRVNKTRVITHWNDCEVCIDEVESLGSFIEIEKLVEKGDADKIQEELFGLLESIGVGGDDRVMVGYDILMLQKNL